MDLNININTDQNCKVVLYDNSTYLPETSSVTAQGKFRKSDTTVLIVLQHHATDGEVTKSTILSENNVPYIQVPIEFDGWFTIHYIVLPSVEWYNRENQKEHGSAFPLYRNVYFADTSNVYKLENGKAVPAELKTIVDINTDQTTISRISKDYVSICFLRKCYINLCQQIFNSRGLTTCSNKSSVDSELVYKRDLVWMAINVIKYFTDLNQLAEVQRIIDRMNSCNGICSQASSNNTSSGCGCSK